MSGTPKAVFQRCSEYFFFRTNAPMMLQKGKKAMNLWHRCSVYIIYTILAHLHILLRVAF